MLDSVTVIVAFVLIALLWRITQRKKADPKFVGELEKHNLAWEEGEVKREGVIVTKLAFETAAAVREKYGFLKSTVANRTIVANFCRGYLRTNHKDLRVVDRVKHAAYATSLAFLPDPYTLQAAEFDADPEVAALHLLGNPSK